LRSEGRAHPGHDAAIRAKTRGKYGRIVGAELASARIPFADENGQPRGLPLRRGWGVCRNRCENCENPLGPSWNPTRVRCAHGTQLS